MPGQRIYSLGSSSKELYCSTDSYVAHLTDCTCIFRPNDSHILAILLYNFMPSNVLNSDDMKFNTSLLTRLLREPQKAFFLVPTAPFWCESCRASPVQTLDLLFPRRQLPESAPSMLRLILEVVGAIAVYDVAFFAWHSTLHSYPTLYRRVHAVHHRCRVQRAPEVGFLKGHHASPYGVGATQGGGKGMQPSYQRCGRHKPSVVFNFVRRSCSHIDSL